LERSGEAGQGGIVARRTHFPGSGEGQGLNPELEGAAAQLPPAGVFISYEEDSTGISTGISGGGTKSLNFSMGFTINPRAAYPMANPRITTAMTKATHSAVFITSYPILLF